MINENDLVSECGRNCVVDTLGVIGVLLAAVAVVTVAGAAFAIYRKNDARRQYISI